MTQEKTSLQDVSNKLRDVLRSHVAGKPTIREMASRIDAEAYRKQAARIRSIADDDATVERYRLSARSACGS